MMRGAVSGKGDKRVSTSPWDAHESEEGYRQRMGLIMEHIRALLARKTHVLLLQECNFARDADTHTMEIFDGICKEYGYAYHHQADKQALITVWSTEVFGKKEFRSLWAGRAMGVKLEHKTKGVLIEFVNLHLRFAETYSDRIFVESLKNMRDGVGTVMGGDHNRAVNDQLFVGMADWSQPTALEKIGEEQSLTTKRSKGKLVSCYDSFTMAPISFNSSVSAKYEPSYRFEKLALPIRFGPDEKFTLSYKEAWYTPQYNVAKHVSGLPWIRKNYREAMHELMGISGDWVYSHGIKVCFTYYKSKLTTENCDLLTRMFDGEGTPP